MWATGVIMFALLTGAAPFPGKLKPEIYNNVCNNEPNYRRLDYASPAAKEFI